MTLDFKNHPKRQALYPNMQDTQIDEQVAHIRENFPQYDNEECILEILGREDERYAESSPSRSWKDLMYQDE